MPSEIDSLIDRLQTLTLEITRHRSEAERLERERDEVRRQLRALARGRGGASARRPALRVAAEADEGRTSAITELVEEVRRAGRPVDAQWVAGRFGISRAAGSLRLSRARKAGLLVSVSTGMYDIRRTEEEAPGLFKESK